VWPWFATAGIAAAGLALWFALTPPHSAQQAASIAAKASSKTAGAALSTDLAADSATTSELPSLRDSTITLANPQANATTPVAATEGRVRIAVTPWGMVEVDGKKMGVSPPLTLLTLQPGEHTIVLRNSDLAARTFRIKVEAGKTERIAHRFE
jgi:PEGA domain